MADYYKNDRDKKVILHFAGEGDELALYKRIVRENGLEEYVIFHGYLTGDALDEFYNEIDIGVCSLGCHRVGIYGCVSVLKSREYLAKGLPIVSSAQVDVLERSDFPYKLYVPQDESNISIERIVEFYESILQSKTEKMIAEEIREFAVENVDMKKMVGPVVGYLKGFNVGLSSISKKDLDK